MIVCPNCNHQNPESSMQCENCYTLLPQTTSCPNCGASVQTDATFCGQCGFNLQAENLAPTPELSETFVGSSTTGASSTLINPWDDEEIETIPTPEPWQTHETEVMSPTSGFEDSWDDENLAVEDLEELEELEELPETTSPLVDFEEELSATSQNNPIFTEPEPKLAENLDFEPRVNQGQPLPSPQPVAEASPPPSPPSPPLPPPQPFSPGGKVSSATQLQIQQASLLHVQTNTTLELPHNLYVIHIGKPNSQIPPDIDVSGFPNSEVVSRIHADIRVEGDTYFLEDVGSSNGTYVNHSPLPPGNRHRLRTGDRISLGKGDLVTFIFQLN
ncbi:FHA domain containing protein [Stanieria cyanosphaera PCC 7437]|uniref:FHA domain containing protein n=1 Tax=Stanieria cyanosphaera (strain ATCC 29371 / PCC 7437) TaxID=111780 RepID=K9XNX9_STAC7|nr:FHA domain-containing protein [Stanieria cyanosphaera]AFZ34320.1 FHA domain containing protein [Stanieria cyanosphaera PCC 7437]